MHYIFLKNIVDTTLENFLCQNCSKKINTESIMITNVWENGVHMSIVCPHCQAHAELKAEIHQMAQEMLQSEHGKAFFSEFMKKWGTIGAEFHQPKQQNGIKNDDIEKIEKDIQWANSIEDLLK